MPTNLHTSTKLSYNNNVKNYMYLVWPLKNGLITRLNISKGGAFFMLFGNEFHILGP